MSKPGTNQPVSQETEGNAMKTRHFLLRYRSHIDFAIICDFNFVIADDNCKLM